MYERDFFIPPTMVEKFIRILDMFNQYGNIKSFVIIYMPNVRVFKATIVFKSGEDYILFHNIVVTFLIGVTVEQSK